MLEEIIELTILENRIADYAIAIVLFLAGLIAVKIFQHLLLRRLKKWAEKTVTTVDDFIVGIIERITDTLPIKLEK